MDLVLDIADYLVFDKVYSAALPLTAIVARQPDVLLSTASKTAHNLSSATAAALAAMSTHPVSAWSNLVAAVPHPPVNVSSPAFSLDASMWPRDYMPRQLLSLSIITLAGIHVLYFAFAYLSFALVFNHEMMKHPRFLKNQIRLEIECSLRAFPLMTLLTLPWFQGEVMGWSRLYDDPYEYGLAYLILSVPFFLLFTDYFIYWVHRLLHHPLLYKHIHKPHHKWLIPTPFASHAFHPVDGYLQSVPYHLFIYLFPLHRILYLVLFVAVNFWSIFIHDSDMITGHALEKLINGPAHHTLHHLYFTVNYGQYFTWADRYYNSYRQPESSLDPLLEVKAAQAREAEASKKEQ